MFEATSPDYATARHNMVENQLRATGIIDPRILAVMNEVPREVFVPFTHVGVAYMDDAIKLISGRYLMRPVVFARLLQAAEITPTDGVLELAPATGYSTLVLTRLAASVSSVEPDALLHKEAEKNLAVLAPGKAAVYAGAPVEGCIANAPFDVIFINGSVDYVPEYLFTQLDEGGRLVAVVRSQGIAQNGKIMRFRKIRGEINSEVLFEADAPLAPGFALPRKFEF
ncbi:MAG: protein-L-isoaspartate O-methyltransferase [Alphaproteobacteria bacterium]|nr:protein-L-isoaspartate O-methyltransferase [Alphaproteobacteria bacterium]